MAYVRWDLLGPDSRLVIQLDRSQQILVRNATEDAARHADNSLISRVLASHAPSIFREMRHCTFVCTENAPLYFRFFGQEG